MPLLVSFLCEMWITSLSLSLFRKYHHCFGTKTMCAPLLVSFLCGLWIISLLFISLIPSLLRQKNNVRAAAGELFV
jgi:competence protein ComGC